VSFLDLKLKHVESIGQDEIMISLPYVRPFFVGRDAMIIGGGEAAKLESSRENARSTRFRSTCAC